MPMKIQEVLAQCQNKGKIVLVQDHEAKVYYIVLNTSYNMIEPDFIN